MSVIIRLQNLPLSAKSADIRHFFRGLRIPDGGVHIVGGDKGDAFIAFNSDEDARIAMRKDRGKIKDSRVKLLLSSYMEMQHAIERITKYGSESPPSKYRSYGQSRQSPRNDRISERAKDYDNENYRSYSPHKNRRSSRSRSPRRSPYKRSFSPDFQRSLSPRRRSPGSRDFSPPRNTSDSYAGSYASENRRNFRSYRDSDKHGRNTEYDERRRSRNDDTFPESPKSLVTSDEQRHLEERIAKALNTGFVENAFGISSSENEKSVMNKQPVLEPYSKPIQPYGEGFFNPIPDHSMIMGNQPPIAMSNPNFIPGLSPMNHLAGNNVPQVNSMPQPAFFPDLVNPSVMVPPPAAPKPFIPFTGYYVTISGLDPLWTNSDLQNMLKGIFAPQDNIRWEVDDSGFKTGTAFIKLMNREDFNQILAQPTYLFNNKIVTVSECPNSVYEKYFPPPSVPPLPGQAIIQDGELYYKVKGLPFTITHEEIMHFFYGFQIADVYLESLPSGKMTGEGYICFTNIADYERARVMHGKKLGLAFIEMIPCTRQEMLDTKRRNNGFFNANVYPPPALPSFEKPPGPKRPLCAMLTGLPFFIKIHRISSFFGEHGLKPDAIHLLVNYKRRPTGRAFVEFSNIRDFDTALKQHGTKIGDNMICVKQVLYDEMTKILSTHKAKHEYAVPELIPEKPARNLVQIPKVPETEPWIRTDDSLHNENSFHENIPQSFKEDNFGNNNRNVHRGKKGFQSGNHSGFRDEYHESEDPYREESDDLRLPVKFEVKIKQSVAKSTKADDAFDRSMKNDATLKLSKLTPEKEIEIVKTITNKTVKEIRMKDTEVRERARFKSPSPYRRKFNADRRKFGSSKREQEKKRPVKYSPVDEFIDDYSSSPRRYSPCRSPEKSYYDKSYIDKYDDDDVFGEVIVEMTNVHPLVGSSDLLDFFYGFDVTDDRMVRRYSDLGEPLGDIRITFLSLREAEKAVKYLNGQYLNGIPVSLFLV